MFYSQGLNSRSCLKKTSVEPLESTTVGINC